jgi:hypothetical protein
MKPSEALSNFVYRLRAHLADSQEMIKHEIVGKPEHSDRIFPHVGMVHLTIVAKRQAVAAINYWHNPQIGGRSEAAIQPNLLTAKQIARLKGSCVGKGVVDRFLNLVDLATCEEDPGHVGLFEIDLGWTVRVELRAPHRVD